MATTTVTGLWPHQEEALRRLLPLPGALLEAGLGAGKSRIALELMRQRGVRRLLLLAPKGACYQWRLQTARWAPGTPVLDLSDGPLMKRSRLLAAFGDGIVIVNYEVLSLVPYRSRSRPTPGQAFTLALALWTGENHATSGVVADEVHNLKAPTGAHSKAVAALPARHRMGMSGTPLAHSPLDVWAIFRAVGIGVFGNSYFLHKRRYTEPCRWGEQEGMDVDRGGALRPFKFTGLDDLRERMYRYTAQVDGAPQIPQIDVVRTVTLEPEVMTFYRRFDKELTAMLGDTEVSALNVLAKISKLQQITSGDVLGEDGERQPVSTAKRKELAAWMEELPSTAEPAVVFCRFRADLDAVHEAAKATGRSSLELSGRRKELREWLHAPGCASERENPEYEHWLRNIRVGLVPRGHLGCDCDNRSQPAILAVQVQAGGAGIELHRAHYCAFYSLTRSLTDYLQARGRLVRPDQVSPWVHLTHLVATGTIDEEVYAAFEAREELLERVYQRRGK